MAPPSPRRLALAGPGAWVAVAALLLTGSAAVLSPSPAGAARLSGTDRAAQAEALNTLTAAEAVYAELGSFPSTPALLSALRSVDRKDVFVGPSVAARRNGASASVGASSDGQQFAAVTRGNGTCWAVTDNEAAATGTLGHEPPGRSSAGWRRSTARPCTAAALAAATPAAAPTTTGPAG